ncbi:nucleoside diphosphate kinase [Halteromyces radiatus]|uniref:nucleoside diphosphate kinase n=1 Tax=Halteromyces radiatus TaxID=101107 RepID=UPI00221EE0DA|nr:nucleoside diphosphate kinase [Halteromyces radiatus]KAI8086165.1 nucleoside diphosphate kinase [Halteromyces radiatus]
MKEENSNQVRYDICKAIEGYSPITLSSLLERTLCSTEQTIAVIKPDGFNHATAIKSILTKQYDFVIVNSKVRTLEKGTVERWYHDKLNQSYFPSLQRYLTRGPVEILLLERVDAIHGLRSLVGPTDPERARQLSPHSIRALFGTNVQENAVHASDSDGAVLLEKSLLLD